MFQPSALKRRQLAGKVVGSLMNVSLSPLHREEACICPAQIKSALPCALRSETHVLPGKGSAPLHP